MKALFLVAVIVFTFIPAKSQSISGRGSVVRTARAIGGGFTAGLGFLDSRHLVKEKLKVVVENTGADFGDPKSREFDRLSFKSFTAMERWLKRHTKKDGTPFRATGNFAGCNKGVCTYTFDGGIDHNHLYLQKIFYGIRNNHLIVKSLYLLAG